jgi:hypothetical protein
MTNKIEILANIKCKSLFSATIPATSEFVAVCKSEQHGFGLLVYFPKTGIYSQVNAGVVQSLDQREVYKALKESNQTRLIKTTLKPAEKYFTHKFALIDFRPEQDKKEAGWQDLKAEDASLKHCFHGEILPMEVEVSVPWTDDKEEQTELYLEAKKIAKECWFAEFPAREGEPLTERIVFLAPPALKEALLNRIDQIRKPGETAHGAMSNFIREAIVLHLARK